MIMVLGVSVGLSLNYFVTMHERVPMAGWLGQPLDNCDRHLDLELNRLDDGDLLSDLALDFLGLLNFYGS